MAERKPLTVNEKGNSEFGQFTTKPADNKKSLNVDLIKKIAKNHGFTSREPGVKIENQYTTPMGFRTREEMKGLIDDICYYKKLKRQEFFEQAVFAYLKQEEMTDLIEKYRIIVNDE